MHIIVILLTTYEKIFPKKSFLNRRGVWSLYKLRMEQGKQQRRQQGLKSEPKGGNNNNQPKSVQHGPNPHQQQHLQINLNGKNNNINKANVKAVTFDVLEDEDGFLLKLFHLN